jgi:ABC-type nitrate/sulfonate/bicarbonate transport system ATPase subunit
MAERIDKMVKENTGKENPGQLKIRNVSKVFYKPDGEKVNALSSVDLDIKPGEFVSLLGQSGCGKSTLLRLIAGLETPTAGNLILDDESIEGTHYERGFMLQNPTLFPWLNVKKNVSVGLDARKVSKNREHEINDFIKLVGLNGFENSFPHQLSGGMAQRVALARALINHPKVLLLDEPLGALDAFTRMYMQDEILRIWKDRKTTMILVTHDVDEAIYMSDKIIIMTPRPGKIQDIIDVKLYRPRERNSPDFVDLRSRILEVFDFAHKYSEEYNL